MTPNLCPLAPGTYINHDGKPFVEPYLDRIYLHPSATDFDGWSRIKIVMNMAGKPLQTGDRLTVVGNDATIADGDHNAVVEQFPGSVPPGCYFRVVMRSPTDVVISKLDRIIAMLEVGKP